MPSEVSSFNVFPFFQYCLCKAPVAMSYWSTSQRAPLRGCRCRRASNVSYCAEIKEQTQRQTDTHTSTLYVIECVVCMSVRRDSLFTPIYFIRILGHNWSAAVHWPPFLTHIQHCLALPAAQMGNSWVGWWWLICCTSTAWTSNEFCISFPFCRYLSL